MLSDPRGDKVSPCTLAVDGGRAALLHLAARRRAAEVADWVKRTCGMPLSVTADEMFAGGHKWAGGHGAPAAEPDGGGENVFQWKDGVWRFRFGGGTPWCEGGKRLGYWYLHELLTTPGRPVALVRVLGAAPAACAPADEERMKVRGGEEVEGQGEAGEWDREAPARRGEADAGRRPDEEAMREAMERVRTLKAQIASGQGDQAKATRELSDLVKYVRSGQGRKGKIRNPGGVARDPREAPRKAIERALKALGEGEKKVGGKTAMEAHLRAGLGTVTDFVYRPDVPRPWDL